MNGASATTHPTEIAAAEPSSAKLILTLGLAGLISGLALVGIYELTLPTIKANNARALRTAVFKVIPGSTQMQKLVRRDGTFAVAKVGDETPGVYGAYDGNGRLVGYGIEAQGNGFQDVIRLLYGFSPAKQQITGMEVLESRETPGLGDKIFKDAAFVSNFAALAVKPQVKLVKNGQREAQNEVDAITGATISSKAVVRIINEANAQWLAALPEPTAAPPLASPAGAGEGKEAPK